MRDQKARRGGKRARISRLAERSAGLTLWCASASKRRYEREGEAEAILARAADRKSDRKVPIRTYFCQHCCGWHLTSQPRKGNP